MVRDVIVMAMRWWRRSPRSKQNTKGYIAVTTEQRKRLWTFQPLRTGRVGKDQWLKTRGLPG